MTILSLTRQQDCKRKSSSLPVAISAPGMLANSSAVRLGAVLSYGQLGKSKVFSVHMSVNKFAMRALPKSRAFGLGNNNAQALLIEGAILIEVSPS